MDLDNPHDLQLMINSGDIWRFEGSVGRAVMDLITAGKLLLGKSGVRDYWGNYVPGRDEVAPGSKGSFQYVADREGDDYAKELAAL